MYDIFLVNYEPLVFSFFFLFFKHDYFDFSLLVKPMSKTLINNIWI